VGNPHWATGMGSSLRVGLAAVPPEAHAVVVALVDQPLIQPEAVRRLILAAKGGASVAVAAYGGRPRNPVLISREHFAEVAELAVGDVGARPFLRRHPELIVKVPCDDAGDPADIDTARDLAALLAASSSGPPLSESQHGHGGAVVAAGGILDSGHRGAEPPVEDVIGTGDGEP
jgi:nicotine blue oxidoreductase